MVTVTVICMAIHGDVWVYVLLYVAICLLMFMLICWCISGQTWLYLWLHMVILMVIYMAMTFTQNCNSEGVPILQKKDHMN